MPEHTFLHEIEWLDSCSIKEEKINESNGKKYIISGAFMHADVPNRNKRVYKKEMADKAIDALRPLVKEGRVSMLVDHPEFFSGPTIKSYGALMTDITNVKEDGYAYYTATIYDTAIGRDLKAIIDAGAKIGVSTRGYGDAKEVDWVNSDGTKSKVVQIENWVLESVDFVDDPAVKDTETYMKIAKESKERNHVIANTSQSNRKGTTQMTIDEFKKESPEMVKQIEDAAVEQTKKEFTEKVSALEEQKNASEKSLSDVKETIGKLVECVKAYDNSLFTVVPETDLLASKDDKIAELEKALEESKKEAETFKAQLEEQKKEYEKKEKESYIEQLKASDKDFFAVESFKNIFDSCLTKEEVQKVYERNSSIMKEIMKKDVPAPAKSVQQTESTEPKKHDTLTAELRTRFNAFNEQRKWSNMPEMTEKQFIENFCK